MTITQQYLQQNPDHVFVFGDNLKRFGKGGAAALRDEPNTYGFITKKYPSNEDSSFYTPTEYYPVYQEEMRKLETIIANNPDKTFLISQLGGGLANKYGIFEEIIQKNIKEDLKLYPNVKFLW